MSAFLARFIGRPIFVLMVTLTITVIGLISLSRLPLAMMPEGIAFGHVNLWINGRDMNPEEVLRDVYEPLEGELLTIPGVVNVWGSCRSSGCRVRIELSPALDPRLAAAEVRDRLQRARAQWPSHVDRWFQWRESSDSIPLMFFGFALPDRSQRWFDLLDKEVVPKLESLDGVGQVSVWGMVDETVRIFFDREKLRQLRMNLRQILDGLQNDNVSIPVGELEDAETSLMVRADLRFHDLQTIRELPIGRGFKLEDVATVERVRSFRDRVSRVNGKYSAMGMIRKTAGANAVEVSKGVRRFLQEIGKQPEFAGLEPIWMFDQGEWIEHSVSTLKRSATTGGVLAFVVLLLFLRRIKMTLAIILATPLSLLVAIAVLFFNDDSLNLLSMAGLTISLGMLVDNSIVVLENIYRLRQKGMPWHQACVRGVQEVGTAVFLATLTTVAVFVPVIFAGDNPSVQKMMTSFGLPLCTALLASLFVALILLPSTTAFVHRGQQTVAVPTARRGPVALFAGLQTRLLRVALRHRLVTFLCLVVLAWGANALVSANLQKGVGSGHDRGQITIEFDFERATTLAEADETAAAWERWLEKKRDQWRIKDLSTRFDRQDGRINVSFAIGTRQEWVRRIVKELRRDLPEQPGVEFEVRSRIGSDDEDRAEEGDRGFLVALSGRDPEYLRRWAEQLGTRLVAAGLANHIDLGDSGEQDEVRIQFRRDRMQELGVDPRILFGTVSAGLRGMQVSRIRQPDGRDVRLIAEYSDSNDMELAELKELQIWSQQTGFRRLGDLAQFGFTRGFGSIHRENGVLTTWIGGERPENVEVDQFRIGLAEVMKTMPVPRGYRWQLSGDWSRQNDDAAALMQAFLLGALLVLLVMGVLFESLVLPLAVFATLPFAIIGGRSGFIIFDKFADNAMMFGMLILAGVIVNNGIVLLDHIVRLQGEGLQRHEAILQGVRDRMRAILMTASTTIVGLLPMIFVDVAAQRGISYVGIATVVAAGLFFGTFLTPLVVPLMYSILDDARVWWQRIRHAARPARALANPLPRRQ